MGPSSKGIYSIIAVGINAFLICVLQMERINPRFNGNGSPYVAEGSEFYLTAV